MQIPTSFDPIIQINDHNFAPSLAPAKPLKLTFFSAPTASSPLEKIKRIWSVLTFMSKRIIQLIGKIMKCFLSIFKQSSPTKQEQKQITQVEIKKVKQKDELKLLFEGPLNYEKFHESLLIFHANYYNNYDLEAFGQLKECDWNMFDQYSNKQEKEIKAGMAVYDAIVKLYVKRFLVLHPELDQKIYLPSLQAVALGIAIKDSWDDMFDNKDFQKFIIPGIGIKKYGKMEIEFLKGIDWNLSLDELRKK